MLDIKNVKKTFNKGTINEKKALNGINLHLNEGDFVTVIGGNGAGKSTTLNMIAGVYPIDSGKIEIDGINISRDPEYKRAKYIGRVFQDPMMGTAAGMEIQENLALALRRQGFDAWPSGRNDILVSGRKVSGSAFYSIGSRNIIHATLLCDVNLDMMQNAVTPPPEKLRKKGIASVRQRVENLSAFSPTDIAVIRESLAGFFCDGESIAGCHGDKAHGERNSCQYRAVDCCKSDGEKHSKPNHFDIRFYKGKIQSCSFQYITHNPHLSCL